MHESGARNRLAGESSPYLLLHAGNPVDWYPWGEEAFAKARAEDKPIFLSVGYSTCYWCHVMERESFSNPEIARQLNDGFVAVKLDREERPDLDEIYMTATQLLTHQGGWPNSVFLTHDLKPFFAGTYFPPRDAMGRPGFPRVLAALREAWSERRAGVLDQAEAVAEAIRQQMSAAPAAALPGRDVADEAQRLLARRFDAESGGFGGAPKFPSPSNLFFLLDRARAGDVAARDMLVATLDGMARGGIDDQIAGGFHRYSTDVYWLVPHFEKMLYDNAALGELYAAATQFSPDAGFARVARTTLDFVLAELTGDHGGFLSALDAETDGHEGAYYTWTRVELESLLGDGFGFAARVFGFDGDPTFEHDRYVLHLPRPLAERAREAGLSVDALLERLEPARRTLLAARSKRKRPLLDDKVLADWNGLMIAGMTRAGEALGEARYVDAARRAARFVLENLREPGTGTLLHAYRAGRAKVPALLDDYAFLVDGLLALHAATHEDAWLAEARRLVAEQDARLADPAHGGYFSAGDDPRLLLRAKAAYDGAVASGAGIAALDLIELARRTGETSYRDAAAALVRSHAAGIAEHPLAHVTLVRALVRLDAPATTAAVARGPLDEEARAVVDATGSVAQSVGAWIPFTLELTIRDGWHVNANPAGLPSLVPTQVEAVAGAVRVRYPAAAAGVYAGRVRIEGEIEAGARAAVRLVYQACDESRCLPPVTREVLLR